VGGTYFLRTYGCQMNEHDSEVIEGFLREMGYEPAPSPEEADVVVFNTCSVRRRPEEKVFSEVGKLRKVKQRRRMVIVVAGCTAQRMGEEWVRKFPFLDVVMGPRVLFKFPDILGRALRGERPIIETDLKPFVHEGLPRCLKVPFKAYVTVMQGCNQFCAYCIVPYVRGREVSRPPEAILREVEELARRGVREVTLIAQNVNRYGRDLPCKVDFADLLHMVHEVEGIRWIRFTTSSPLGMTEKLIRAVAELPKVCEHFHIPVQSGDNEVLRRMNRGYTVEQFEGIVRKIREVLPEASITTDVMVGFPGETEEAFRNTLELFRRVEFDQAFMFIFDPRPGTRAERMPDQVPEEVKKRRHRELVSLQNEISKRKNERLLGRVFEVLVDGPSEKDRRKLSGRTRTNKIVIFEGPKDLAGKFVKVEVKEATLWGFKGKLAEVLG